MKSSFPGFPKESLTFFRQLQKNNNREWFDAHKMVYLEKVKAPMEELVGLLSEELLRFAPKYATEPKRSLYRIYRDTRFSEDKTPYKTHQAAHCFRSDLPKNEASGFYFHFSHKELGIGGGAYMPMADHLRAIRAHLLDHHERFRKILAAKLMRQLFGGVQGDSLSRLPKGFPAGHPAGDLIQMKQWFFWRELDPGVAITPSIVKELVKSFEAMAPAIEFLNEPLVGLQRQARQKLLKMDESWL